MGERALRQEDMVGLAVAVLLHVLLVAVIAVQMFFTPEPPPIPNRVSVSLATEVSLESTAPEPVPESRAAIAPTLSDEVAPPPEPDPADTSQAPPPRPETRSAPRERMPPTDTRDRRRPEDTRSNPRTAERAGGSQIGDNFLEGSGESTRTDDTRIPANEIGAAATASLRQAINRQLKPHWSAPSGVDAEKLVSVVSWRMNEDGSIAGTPRCNTQSSSITDSNRPQAALHCERAIRAIRQAAPFDLPDQYYEAWKNIRAWRFDRRL